ncbi:MAG TPA: type VI secretion system baseplate subunit TssF [Polyangia bacterium]|nr:type VI secretion system baseplate subunit TssF [Polyangia bacterium]
MDPRLLQYYNRELQYMREMGSEFAREFPKVAGRLGLETFECSDPYVERLLEGFAFLAARVHLKIDAEFPRFSQHLLEIIYPHYLAPTPSMAVVQLSPNPGEGALALGYQVPRGTAMRSLLGRGEQTSCEYRTGHDVTLWPLELVHAEYTGYVGDLGDAQLPGRARAALRLRLRSTAGLKFSELALDNLTFFLRGSEELPTRLYEQLMGRALAVIARPPGKPAPWQHVVTDEPTAPVGFDDQQALLPFGPRSFHGYRLLHEYFAFPARYLFVSLNGLGPAVRRCTGNELELLVLTDVHERALDGVVSADNLALYCTPAVNLFPRRADRIHLTEATTEYHVVPDRTRPMDFEVYSIREVMGYGSSADVKQPFHPFFAWNDQSASEEALAYYSVSRQGRLLSARQRAQGARSSYVGSEVFISLVDPDEGPYRSSLRQLAIETTCTNRDLPLHMTIGQGRTDFTLESGAPVEAIRCLAGPTPPRASHAIGDTSWRLISHLSLNYLSLVDTGFGAGERGAALREMLSLYCDLTDPGSRKQIDGVRGTSCAGITRALPVPGPTTFGRGLEITLNCDEGAFEGSGVFLLGAVLERFFAKYVSLNSFTETVLRTVQRGEIMRWPARLGLRQVL